MVLGSGIPICKQVNCNLEGKLYVPMDSIKRIGEDSKVKLRIRVRSGPRIRANSRRIRIRANSCESEPASLVEVADGFVGGFMSRIPLVLFGDSRLPVDVPLLRVRPDVGYLPPAVVYVAASLQGVSVEEGRQLLLHLPEVMEHVSRAMSGWSSSAWGCCWKPLATAAVRNAVSRFVGSCWLRRAQSMVL